VGDVTLQQNGLPFVLLSEPSTIPRIRVGGRVEWLPEAQEGYFTFSFYPVRVYELNGLMLQTEHPEHLTWNFRYDFGVSNITIDDSFIYEFIR